MEELTIDDLKTGETALVTTSASDAGLIQLTQIPIIEEHLHEMKSEIIRSVEQAKKLVCSPETLVSVRAVRTDLNKRKAELDADLRKIRVVYMAPWEKLRQTYIECVEVPVSDGVSDLGKKISDVEQGIISECVAECRRLFDEECAAAGIDWLTFERGNFHIGLAEAKQKTYKKAKDAVRTFLNGVSCDMQAILQLPDSAEVMAEYKQSLSFSSAVATVNDRHRRIEEEEARRKAQEERRQAEAEAAVKVYAAAATAAPIPAPSPVAAPTPVPAVQEKVYRLNFSICGTKPQLMEFKKNFVAYCEERGIRYE